MSTIKPDDVGVKCACCLQSLILDAEDRCISCHSHKVFAEPETLRSIRERLTKDYLEVDFAKVEAQTLIGRLESATGIAAEPQYKDEVKRAQWAAEGKAYKEQLEKEWSDRRRFARLREPVQLNLPIADRGIADLIRDRAALWMRRSDKWHGILNRERAWTWRGVALPGVLGAAAALAVVLNALGVLHVPAAAAWPAVATVITALISLRANEARTQLEIGKAGEAWVIADRMAEHYRGLVARVDLADDDGPTIDREEVLAGIFHESQKLEAAARFGLPGTFAEVLSQVTR